jgi:hypothetical protein
LFSRTRFKIAERDQTFDDISYTSFLLRRQGAFHHPTFHRLDEVTVSASNVAFSHLSAHLYGVREFTHDFYFLAAASDVIELKRAWMKTVTAIDAATVHLHLVAHGLQLTRGR